MAADNASQHQVAVLQTLFAMTYLSNAGEALQLQWLKLQMST